MLLRVATVFFIGILITHAAVPGDPSYAAYLNQYTCDGNSNCEVGTMKLELIHERDFVRVLRADLEEVNPPVLVTDFKKCFRMCDVELCPGLSILESKGNVYCNTARVVKGIQIGEVDYRGEYVEDVYTFWVTKEISDNLPKCMTQDFFNCYVDEVIKPIYGQSPSQSTPIKVSSASSIAPTEVSSSSSSVSTMAGSQTPTAPASTKGHTDDVKVTTTIHPTTTTGHIDTSTTVSDAGSGGETEEGTKTTGTYTAEKTQTTPVTKTTKTTSGTKAVSSSSTTTSTSTSTTTTTRKPTTTTTTIATTMKTDGEEGQKDESTTREATTTTSPKTTTTTADEIQRYNCTVVVGGDTINMMDGNYRDFEGVLNDIGGVNVEIFPFLIHVVNMPRCVVNATMADGGSTLLLDTVEVPMSIRAAECICKGTTSLPTTSDYSDQRE